MQSTAYCHIEVRGTSMKGHGTMIVPVLTQLMHVLHGIFSRYPNFHYAIDLPEMKNGTANKPAFIGHMMRVFSSSRDGLDHLLDEIEQHEKLNDYLVIGRVRKVPENFNGKWVSLHRSRIAPRTQPENRFRELALQKSRQTPYFQVKSKSTQQSFSLLIDRRVYGSGTVPSEGKLNSYGLSHSKMPFYLPDIPL